jgi:hypothetical protein
MGKRTFLTKTVNTVFKVRNIAQDQRTIRIFGTPVYYDTTRDLLRIPEISEADIRHSLLKGELKEQKIKGFIEVIESTIDLTQFDSEQRAFLQSMGISTGVASAPDAVANIAELSALDDSLFTDGTILGMLSILDIWQLNRNSNETTDGITIIDTNSGSGQWLRKGLSDRYWAQQATWNIDPSSGDDENSGLTFETAVKTLAEFARRILDQEFNQDTTINILGNISETDRPLLRFRIGDNGFVVFRGQRTSILTGTFTSVTDLDKTTDQPAEVVDTAIPTSWAASGTVNKRIRITGGDREGAISWVAKSLASKTARLSGWIADPWAVNPWNPFVNVAATDVQIGDPYVVESLTTMPDLLLDVIISHLYVGPSPSKLFFEDLAFPSDNYRPGHFRIYGKDWSTIFIGCDTGYLSPTNASCVYFVGCRLAIPYEFYSGRVVVRGGIICGHLSIYENQVWDIDLGTILQGQYEVTVRGGQLTGELGVFDTDEDWCIRVQAGGVVRSTYLWGGAGCTGYGIKVYSGGMVVYTNKPTISGSTGDAMVGGSVKTWAEIPFVNSSNNAIIVADA